MLQPVHVFDVVATVLRSLTAAEAGLTLDVLGPEAISCAVVLKRLRRAQGLEPARLLCVPYPLVLALAALVYAHYFRPRTTALGRYFGIYREGRLAAMIGERMATDDWQEISAVCTHPDFNGLGYARRLLAWLSNDNLARGRMPFLHVSRQNLRARQLYEENGYHDRCGIAFWSLAIKARPG